MSKLWSQQFIVLAIILFDIATTLLEGGKIILF